MTMPPPHPEHRDGQADSAADQDRRRPGRPDVVSPELLPLLRGQVDPQLDAEAALDQVTFGNPDQTRAATGVAVSLAVSGVMWFGIIRLVGKLV